MTQAMVAISQEPTRAKIVLAAKTLEALPGCAPLDRTTLKSILAFDKPTDRQIRCLWTILGRYASQFAEAGLDYAQLVPPPLPAAPQDGRAPIDLSTNTPSNGKPPKNVLFALGKNSEWVAIIFKFHPKLHAVVQNLPQRRYDEEGVRGGVPKAWVIPTDPTSIEAAMSAFREVGPEVVITLAPEIQAVLDQGKRTYVESRAESADIVVPTKIELYPFQKAGVKGIDDRGGRALLADEMGLGKSPQSLGWIVLRKEKALPALVVCKAMLKPNWVNETEKFTDLKCHVIAGANSVGQFRKLGLHASTTPEPGFDITIINYDLLSVETPKTWIKMLLNDDKEQATKKRIAKFEKEGKKSELREANERLEMLLKERNYGGNELVRAGHQASKLLEGIMKSNESLVVRNRVWKALEAIKGNPKALAENGPEYFKCFVNALSFPEFMKFGFQTVIFDESHYIKEMEAQRTIVSIKMAREIPHVMCLTGTPILNRPKDLWSQTQAVDPSLFPVFFPFGKEFCDAFQKPIGTMPCSACKGSGTQFPDKQPKIPCNVCDGEGRITRKAWVFSGVSNIDKLEKILRSTIMIRRMKEQVLKELPKKTRTMMPFVIEEAAERKYRKGTLTPMQRLAKLKKERDEWKALLSGMTDEDRTKYIAKHAEQSARANSLSGLILDDIEKIKQEAVDARFEESLAFILDVHEQEGKILVFASHHATIDRLVLSLGKEGIRTAAIDGRVDAGKREDIKKSFQEGDLEVLVCGIRAAAEGLTLTAAHIVIMMEMDWNPGIHAQAEDRAHRIGQSMPVTVYYLIAMGTIEEQIAKMVDAKREVMFATLGEGGRTLSEDGILDAVMDEILRKAA